MNHRTRFLALTLATLLLIPTTMSLTNSTIGRTSTTIESAILGRVAVAGQTAVLADPPSRALSEPTQDIEALEEQVRKLRRQVVEQFRQLAAAAELRDLTAEANRDDALADWLIGYRLAGGSNEQVFTSGAGGGILRCENTTLDPSINNAGLNSDGSTDWGMAQINDRWWVQRFKQWTGYDFHPNILNATLNGYASARIEQEHGLDAWSTYNAGCGR